MKFDKIIKELYDFGPQWRFHFKSKKDLYDAEARAFKLDPKHQEWEIGYSDNEISIHGYGNPKIDDKLAEKYKKAFYNLKFTMEKK